MTETASKDVSLLTKFVREISYTGASEGFTMLFGMVNTMILARYLPRHEYGIFLLLGILAGFLSMISTFGLDVSVVPSIASAAGEDKSKIAHSVVTFRLLTFGLVSVIFFLGQRWFLLLFGESDIGGLAIFVPFMLTTQGYGSLLRAILRGFFRFKQMALIAMVTSVLNSAMIIFFILVLKASFTGLVFAQIISQGFACLALYQAIPGPRRLQLHRAHLLQVIRFGWPLQVNDILNFVFGNAGNLITAALMGPGDVALLSMAARLPGMVQRLFGSFRNVYLPNLSKLLADGDQRRAHQLLNTSLRLTSFATALGALVAALFGREIILLLFSEQYLASVTAFVLLMVALNVDLVGNILGTSLVAAGDSKGPTISNVIASVMILPTNLMLIPLLGINGVPLAGATGSLVAILSNIWFLRRRQIFAKMAGTLKSLLIFVGFWVPILYFQSIPWLYRGPLLILFLIICYLLSVIEREDLRNLSFVRRYLVGKTQAKVVILSKEME